MIIHRDSKKRGRSQIDWLDSYHTFSFADYYDENWMGFGVLRVINEDYIKPGSGFGLHPHRNMEIITYVVSGELEHKDSLGNGSIIRPGEIQRMSAGTGVRHSEFNHSKTDELHLLQIWILPESKGIKPSYEQKQIPQVRNSLILLGADKPTEQAVMIHQHSCLYAGYFDKGQSFTHTLLQHQAWIQLIKGRVQVNEYAMHAGDGLGAQDEKELRFNCIEDAVFLFFEMGSSHVTP